MTRYEKFKPGMAFLLGEENVETVEDAAWIAYDVIDCAYCPCFDSCTAVHKMGNDEDGSALEECRQILLGYLQEEIECE